MLRLAAALLCLFFVLGALCAQAARPLPDLHKWDSYFALFARNSSVPWKETTVRLDTYSSAPVDFSVFAVDPADVIVAGSNARPRVLATAHLHPVATWRFAPVGGYRFESSYVAVPLGSREGFFVVEARRKDVAQQVWINRSRIGLLSKQCAGEVLLYGADLGTGRALSNMRVSFLTGGRFVVRNTDAHGLIAWRDAQRPIFALAEFASSKAFVSLLPQAPLPNALAGVFVDSAVVHAGERLRVVGFARTRAGAEFKPARGQAEISVRAGPSELVRQAIGLDAAGAFATGVMIPETSPGGDYTVLVSAANASAGTVVHVDANAAGMTLKATPVATAGGVNITVAASHAGLPVGGATVRIVVVRSPHIAPAVATNVWGVSKILDQACRPELTALHKFRSIVLPMDLPRPTAFASLRRVPPRVRGLSCRQVISRFESKRREPNNRWVIQSRLTFMRIPFQTANPRRTLLFAFNSFVDRPSKSSPSQSIARVTGGACFPVPNLVPI